MRAGWDFGKSVYIYLGRGIDFKFWAKYDSLSTKLNFKKEVIAKNQKFYYKNSLIWQNKNYLCLIYVGLLKCAKTDQQQQYANSSTIKQTKYE